MANMAVGLHGDGGFTAVQADGRRDREKWVVQFAGDWKECGTPLTLSKFLNSVICQDRQKGTPSSPIFMANNFVGVRANIRLTD